MLIVNMVLGRLEILPALLVLAATLTAIGRRTHERRAGTLPRGRKEEPMGTRDAAERQRARMARRQLAARGITDEAVLEAMAEVPRERFVTPADRRRAYDDRALPIEADQTISQPYVVAAMLEALEVGPEDRALEIGAGSGYATAVLARLAGRVEAVERHAELARLAATRLADLGITNAAVHCADGTRGRPEGAPYDAILVSAGAPMVPEQLFDQLAVGGRLVIPVGSREGQQLLRVRRTANDQQVEERLGAVRFVPLVGQSGWPGDEEPDDPEDPEHGDDDRRSGTNRGRFPH